MAQNFWIAIAAFTTCLTVTWAVSRLSEPKPEAELTSLVYGLTETPRENVAWYLRPAPLATLVAAMLITLNLIFW